MMPSDEWSQHALDTVDRFTEVADRLAGTPLLRDPEFRAAAAGLHEITVLLLRANENLARWLHLFRQFRFRGDDAGQRFGDLVQRYATAKAGHELHEMKFRCGDIWII